ncbi:MAG: hypothetical protein Q8K21_17165 [Hydrogenophaga sp.]|uniref:hypothetical protein n=1 Tax=Hydrogenophaga sp. TaxID=1904254 RepID=UPI00272F183B|nr:hypothetical protein [Hydrogenophaga sp.]MDP2165913.1 hypothetical protein [Hydrogenophaga sp.]MDP3476156.1 hypothetical protein [Hydrogenophaga sp.]
MIDSTTDLSDARAWVIDGSPPSRSTLVAPLRQFDMGTVAQCPRLVDARRKLDMGTFDVVVCEHYFERELISGQDLRDDLRRTPRCSRCLSRAWHTASKHPRKTVAMLLDSAQAHLHGKLIESAFQVLQRHGERMEDQPALAEQVQAMRDLYRATEVNVGLGDQATGAASSTGAALPAGYKPPSTKGLLSRLGASADEQN